MTRTNRKTTYYFAIQELSTEKSYRHLSTAPKAYVEASGPSGKRMKYFRCFLSVVSPLLLQFLFTFIPIMTRTNRKTTYYFAIQELSTEKYYRHLSTATKAYVEASVNSKHQHISSCIISSHAEWDIGRIICVDIIPH